MKYKFKPGELLGMMKAGGKKAKKAAHIAGFEGEKTKKHKFFPGGHVPNLPAQFTGPGSKSYTGVSNALGSDARPVPPTKFNKKGKKGKRKRNKKKALTEPEMMAMKRPKDKKKISQRHGRVLKNKNWIAEAVKKPGGLHRSLGIKADHTISAKTLGNAAKKGGKVGKQARLAETLKSFHHKRKVGYAPVGLPKGPQMIQGNSPSQFKRK